MEVIRGISEMKNRIKEIKAEQKSIGFVPTMGYLHDGHKSLIDKSRRENDVVVVSVFVNPAQFGPNEDFERYPRDEERDKEICMAAGCDIMFMPDSKEMYGRYYSTYVDVLNLTEGLCGSSRPGHFRGVATVVTKLFNIVKPDRAYFGKKDAQQLAVIKRMSADLNMDIEIVGCPIIREKDGLAMSSRNTYLNEDERNQALVLYKSLKLAQEMVNDGEKDVRRIKDEMIMLIRTAKDAQIDYVEFVDSENLKPVEKIDGEILVALAVKIGKTRLIDNITINS